MFMLSGVRTARTYGLPRTQALTMRKRLQNRFPDIRSLSIKLTIESPGAPLSQKDLSLFGSPASRPFTTALSLP